MLSRDIAVLPVVFLLADQPTGSSSGPPRVERRRHQTYSKRPTCPWAARNSADAEGQSLVDSCRSFSFHISFPFKELSLRQSVARVNPLKAMVMEGLTIPRSGHILRPRQRALIQVSRRGHLKESRQCLNQESLRRFSSR